jgi:hypothetical protein
MNAETASAWAAWLAAVIAAVSVFVAVRATLHSKAAVAEARRSADAAEKSVAAAEKSATEARRSADAAERQAAAAEKMIPPPQPKVAWKASRTTSGTFLLRHVGTEAARDVNVTVPGWDPHLVRSAPGPLVRPDGQIVVQVFENAHTPELVEFHVTWDGQADPVSVTLPGW